MSSGPKMEVRLICRKRVKAAVDNKTFPPLKEMKKMASACKLRAELNSNRL